MVNKWVTILIVLLALYSFYKNQPNYHTASKEDQKQTHELVDKLKNYIDILSVSPKNKSLEEEKSINPYKEIKLEDIAENPDQEDSTPKSNLESNNYTQNNPNNEINEKLYSITYNLLHSAPGKFLLEKFLLSPDANKANHKQPTQYINNSIIDVIEGSGSIKADCGDTVEVSYIIRLVDGKEIENTYKQNKTITFQIGEKRVIKGLEYALIGMREGGIRRLIAPPNFAYADPKYDREMLVGNEFVTIDVELVKLKSSLTRFKDKVKIFDNSQMDNSQLLLCSTRVDFTYKLSTIDEKVISNSTDVHSIILGSKMLPDAINAGLLGLSSNANRLIILPASLVYKQKISFLPKNTSIPSTGTLILDINTFGKTE